MRLLPDSAYSLYGLRLLSLALAAAAAVIVVRHGRRVAGLAWALAPILLIAVAPGIGAFLVEYSIDPIATLLAVASMALLFREPDPRRFGASVALGTLSLLVMPKFALPLAGGFLLSAVAFARQRRLVACLAAGAAGLAAAALIGSLFYALSPATFADDLRYAHVFTSRYVLVRPIPYRLWQAVVFFLLQNPLFAILVGAGLAGWRRHAPGTALLPAAGCLAGALASALLLHNVLEQYVLPVVVTAALFIPFAARLAADDARRAEVVLFLSAGLLLTAGQRLGTTVPDLRHTFINTRNPAFARRSAITAPPAFRTLRETEKLLRLVPPGERVLALSNAHPIFRRDLTFINNDERPSFADALGPDDPAKSRFSPEFLREALPAHPPALIAMPGLDANYPPGWEKVCEEFLGAHADLYANVGTRENVLAVRRDLLPRAVEERSAAR